MRTKYLNQKQKPSNNRRANRNSSLPRSHENKQERLTCRGVLELHPKGYGFLRNEYNLNRNDNDVFVPESTISKYGLKLGTLLEGKAQQRGRSNGPRLDSISTIEGLTPFEFSQLSHFDERAAVNPKRWLQLEQLNGPTSMRVLDLLCPLGLGQRALIASPPRAGKTTLIRQIGNSISTNHPDIQLVALLIDERPEEVTELREELTGQIYASCLDQDIQSHARLSRMVIERCKRMAESGQNVLLLLDSLTRMSRAFNKLPGLTGPVGAGGLNIRALDIPKQTFASARAFSGNGSLTIVATVLIETENRMDEVIFQEFKGTGNYDLILDQKLADQRIWPAVDIKKSGTRRVELLQDKSTLAAATALRNSMMTMHPSDAMKELVAKLQRFVSNDQFVALINEKLY